MSYVTQVLSVFINILLLIVFSAFANDSKGMPSSEGGIFWNLGTAKRPIGQLVTPPQDRIHVLSGSGKLDLDLYPGVSIKDLSPNDIMFKDSGEITVK